MPALSVPALCACERRFLFVADPFPKHLLERNLPSTVYMPGSPSSVGRAGRSSPERRRFDPASGHEPFFPAGLCLHREVCSCS